MAGNVTQLGFNVFFTSDGRGLSKARKDLTGMQRLNRELFDATKLGAGAAVVAVGALALSLGKVGIESNALQQKVSKALQITTGSVKNANEQLEKLNMFAKESPFSRNVWLKAQQQLQAFGVQTKKVVPLLAAVEDAVVAAGGSEEEINGVVRAFGQIASKGKVYAEELLQIGERGVDAAGVVGEAMGKTSGEIRAMVTTGRISTDEFFSAFTKGSEQAFGGASEGARQTFDGMVDRVKGSHRRIGEILMTPFVNPQGGGALVEIGNAVADASNDIEAALRPMGQIWANQLEGPVRRAADAIRDFGAGATTDGLLAFFDRIKNIIPIVTALGTAVGVHLGGQFLSLLPGLQGLTGAATPLAFALGSLAVTSPEVRDAMMGMNAASSSLMPSIAKLATIVANVLTVGLKVVAPLIKSVATAASELFNALGPTLSTIVTAGAALAFFALHSKALGPWLLVLTTGTKGVTAAMIALRTAMLGHPILLVASIVAAFVAIAGAMDKTGEASTRNRDTIIQTLSDIKTASDKELSRVGVNFQETAELIGLADKSMGGLNNSLDELSRITNGKIRPSDEDIKAFQDEGTAIDDAVAGLIREGDLAGTTGEVHEYLTEELGFTEDAYQRLLPMLSQTSTELERYAEELGKISSMHGDAVAAVQGLGKEMEQQADPVLGLISAHDEMRNGLAEFDGTEASLVGLFESMVGMQQAGEAATGFFGDELPEDFKALAEAAGLPVEHIEQLEDLWVKAQESFGTTADRFAAKGSDFMANYVSMLSGMDVETATTVLNVKESMDSLMDGGMGYSEALQMMSEETGLSTTEIQQGFNDAHAAGVEFSTDYPATITATPVMPEMEDAAAQVTEFILGMQESIQEQVQGLIATGVSKEDAVWMVSQWYGMDESDVEKYWAGISVKSQEESKKATDEGMASFQTYALNKDWGNWFGKLWSNIWGFLQNLPGRIWDSVVGWFDNPEDGDPGWWDGVSDWFGNLWSNIWGWLQNVPGNIWDAVVGWFSMDGMGTVWWSGFSVIDWFEELWGHMWSWLSAVPGRIWDSVVSWFSTTDPGWASNVSTWMRNIWTTISAWFGSIWTNISSWLSSIWTNITSWFGSIRNSVSTKMGEIWSNISSWWSSIWTNTTGWISSLWSGISSGFSNIWTNISGWMSSIWSTVTSVWTNIKNFVVGLWQTVLGSLSNIWSRLGTIASIAWNKVRDAIAAPVNFVVTTVYTNGIKKVWDAIDSTMFGGKNPLPSITGGKGKGNTDSFSGGGGKFRAMATGGFLRGPGTSTSDSIPTLLSDGEYVLRAAAVRKYGVGNIEALNQMQVPGYAMGGLITSAGGLFKGGVDKVFDMFGETGIGKWFANVASISSGLTKLTGSLNGIPVGGGSKLPRDMIHKGMSKPVDRLKALFEMISSAVGSGDAPQGYRAMYAWIKSIVPSTTLNSGFRPGDPGYHGRGLAIDMGFGDRSEFTGGGDAKKAFLAISGAYKKATAELIWDFSPWGQSKGIWNGKDHTFGGATSGPGTHRDHIHWATSGAGAGPGGGMMANGKGGVGQWTSIVMQALRLAGESTKWANAVLTSINQESSGRPNLVNNWDSNAKAGIPSKGLNQVIDPTFNAYAGPLKPRGVFDPLANIYASIVYARSRYGSNWASVMSAPGGYATGVRNAPRGAAWVGENGPELMNFRGGESVTPVTAGGGEIHVHIHNSVIASEKQAEDIVVKAVKNAKKSGRI